jgi:chromosome segregation ATPase
MNETQAEPVIEEKPEAKKYSDNPLELQAKIEELLNENASRRVKNKELNEELGDLRKLREELEARKTAEMAEQGKYKELLEEREKKLAELSPLPEKVTKYEQVFKGQLEAEIKDLPETLSKLILDSGKDVAEQLEMARSLKAELGKSTSSPGAERPGGDVMTQDVSQLVDKYKKETDIMKRSVMLQEIKLKMPEVWKTL